MEEIPLLYKLACWAYSGTWITGYQKAFNKAILEGERPCLIIMRVTTIARYKRYPI